MNHADHHRVENDDALRNKVSEALLVYKEYMKNRGDGPSGDDGMGHDIAEGIAQ